MTTEAVRKWSVEEFYGLIRHNLIGSEGPVELIEGLIVPLPTSAQRDRQVERLRGQLQRALAQANFEGVEVRAHHPIQINPYSELRPTLTVLSMAQSPLSIHWVIEIDKAGTDLAATESQDLRTHLYAHHGIAEYWALSTEQVELRTHHTPKATMTLTTHNQLEHEQLTPRFQYQHHQLQHADEQVSPKGFPPLVLQLQEPLPLYFLTRTATGHRAYLETALPLQVRS